jgi:hypothetical protein
MFLQCKTLVYFSAIWHIFGPFGIFCGHLVYLWPFGIFCGPLVHLIAIWYIIGRFGIFLPGLVCRTKKNLATLLDARNPASLAPKSCFGISR